MLDADPTPVDLYRDLDDSTREDLRERARESAKVATARKNPESFALLEAYSVWSHLDLAIGESVDGGEQFEPRIDMAPAHSSWLQNRLLQASHNFLSHYKKVLEALLVEEYSR